MSGETAWSFASVLAAATSLSPEQPPNDALAVRVEERLEHQPEAGPRRREGVNG